MTINKAVELMDCDTSVQVRIAFSERRERLFEGWHRAFEHNKDNMAFWSGRIQQTIDAQIALGMKG